MVKEVPFMVQTKICDLILFFEARNPATADLIKCYRDFHDTEYIYYECLVHLIKPELFLDYAQQVPHKNIDRFFIDFENTLCFSLVRQLNQEYKMPDENFITKRLSAIKKADTLADLGKEWPKCFVQSWSTAYIWYKKWYIEHIRRAHFIQQAIKSQELETINFHEPFNEKLTGDIYDAVAREHINKIIYNIWMEE